MRIPLAVFLVAQMAIGATAAEKQWLGTLDVGAAKLRLQLVVVDAPDDMSGFILSLDQGKARIELDSIALADGSLAFSAKKIGASFEGKVSDDGKSVKGTFTQGGRKFPLTFQQVDQVADDKLLESWVGTLSAGGQKLRLQFRIVETAEGKRITKFDSLNQDAIGLSAESEFTDNRATFTVKPLNAKFAGTLSDDGTQIEGTWSQGIDFPMTMEKVKTAESAVKRKRPQTPKAPFPYDVREVEFDSQTSGVKLAGTLTTPRTAGPHAAVVMVSGSGAQDRDETIFQHKPFHVIADHLTRAGIAVLRFDDRGVGKSTGDHAAATTLDFAKDAAGAVAFLRSQPKIAADHIGIIGHSEGGLIAPLVAAADPELGFIVLLAGTGVPGNEILREQGARISQAGGAPAATIQASGLVRDAVMQAIQTADADADMSATISAALETVVAKLPEEQKAEFEPTDANVAIWRQLATPWMRFFVGYDPRPTLEKVRCPVLVLNGDLDLQVWHEQNVPEIEKALSKSGASVRTVVFPKLNHLFQPAKTGAVSEYVDIETTVAPVVLTEIAQWIKSIVAE